MKKPNWPIPKSMDRTYLSLDRIIVLLDKLGNPQDKIPPVFHIAGTNGKGSVSSFLKYMLEDAGYKVHRFTSPHLVNFNERIEVSSSQISDEYYNQLAEECKFIVEKYNLEISYFEAITTIAFMAFARNEAEATVLEVGMGGRLDATNVIKQPLASIITSISLDHTKALGDTVEKIAIEKAGIMKQGSNCLIAKQEQDSIYNVFQQKAKEVGCYLYQADKDWSYERSSDSECLFKGLFKMFQTPLPSLLGEHQINNAGVAIASLVSQNQIKITNDNIKNGLVGTKWIARLQDITDSVFKKYLESNDRLILDGGHNEGGARVISDFIKSTKNNDTKDIAIIVMLERKDSTAFTRELADSFDEIILPQKWKQQQDIDQDFKESKYKDALVLKEDFKNNGFDNCTIVGENIQDALNTIQNKYKNVKKRIVICGSLYFAGEVLGMIETNNG